MNNITKDETIQKFILILHLLLVTIFLFFASGYLGRGDKIKKLEIEASLKDLYFDKWLNESIDHINTKKELGNCEYLNDKLEIFVEEFDCECYCGYCEEPSFLDIAGQVARLHEYEKDVYDCTQFSNKLKESLEAFGWKSEVRLGLYRGQLHEWTCITEDVCIEAVHGKLIEPYIYDEFYEVIR